MKAYHRFVETSVFVFDIFVIINLDMLINFKVYANLNCLKQSKDLLRYEILMMT